MADDLKGIAAATLAGVDLLALNEVGWAFTSGVRPYQRTFTIARGDLDNFLAATENQLGAGGIELNINWSDGSEFHVHRLFFLHTAPAMHPDMVNVLISDVRWMWPYVSIVRRYNVKRRTGNKRFVDAGNGQLQQLLSNIQFTTDDQVYAAFSLKPPQYKDHWKAEDVIRDVLYEVTSVGTTGPTGFDVGVDYANAVEVEGLELDDTGEAALARVMALVPGTNCRINEVGVTVLYNENDGSEQQVIGSAGDAFVGSPLPEQVDRSVERPVEIHVHISCEDELRFDFVEGSTQDQDGRWLRNVMPLPVSLTFGGHSYGAGTWIEITDDLLAAFSATYPPITPSGKTLPTLTLAILRQIWCNGGYSLYHDCLANQDPIYTTWLNVLRKHYRQTFQINIRWMERLLGILDRRVSLIDPLNNAWAPAAVYANYALVPSYRRAGKTDGDPTQLAYNRTSFPTPSAAPGVDLNANGLLAQAILTVEDATLGIIHVNYFIDALGNTMSVVPSNIEGYNPALNAAGSVAFPLPDASIDGPFKVLSHCRMVQPHALSIVVTGVTGSPNGLGQTYDRTVTFDEARRTLPAGVQKQLQDAVGPAMHVHCNARTARFAWSDAQSAKIERAVIYGDPRDPTLLVNPDEVDAVAKALAASIYSAMVDQALGDLTVALNSDLEIKGRISSIQHGLQPDGVAFTKVSIPAVKRPTFDFWSLLPEFVRRTIKRQLPQPR